MSFRPAGFSSDEDDYDGFGGFDFPTAKPNSYSQNSRYDLGETRESNRKEVSNMERLKEAILNEDVKELNKILSNTNGININGEFESISWTPLLYAASLGSATIVSELLINGADPNVHKESFTPLMAVCSCENGDKNALLQCAEDLISFGAKVNVSDRFGMTPLMFASLHGHEKIVDLLLSSSRIDSTDSQGWTALFFAASRGHVNIVELLTSVGSDITKKDIRGNTVRQIAIDKGFNQIVELVTDPNELNIASLEEIETNQAIPEWQDLFPGLKDHSKHPAYFEDVKCFLYGVNLPRYISVFETHQIGFPQMLTLSDGHLETVGVYLPFERRLILRAVHAFHGRRWSKKTIAYMPKELFSMYDVLYNLGITNKHFTIIAASLKYLNFRLNDEKIAHKIDINILRENKEALLKDIATLRKRIVSTKLTLRRLQKEISKIEKHVTPPADYITATNFKVTKFGFSKKLTLYGLLTLGVFYVFKKRDLLKEYSLHILQVTDNFYTSKSSLLNCAYTKYFLPFLEKMSVI